MKDLSDAINSVGKQCFDLRNAIIAELVQFVKTHGLNNSLNIEFDVKEGGMEIPGILSCDNRHTDSYCFAEIDSLEIIHFPTKDRETVLFNTEYDSVYADSLDLRELVDIYDEFKMFSDGDYSDDIEIVDGTMMLKEIE